MSFASFLESRGILTPRLTKSGRADRRYKRMAALEEEWFNITIKGEKVVPSPSEDKCPVCYDVLGDARVTTSCGHQFCISCFTCSVRESDNCAMCRAPLSNTQPKKFEPMGTHVSHNLLCSTITELSSSMISDLYDTLYHDIGAMEEEIEGMGAAHQSSRQGARRMRVRQEYIAKMFQLISERYMVFGYNVLHRANLWFTETSSYPFNPERLLDALAVRRDEGNTLRRTEE